MTDGPERLHKNPRLLIVGEALVEIMRPEPGIPLGTPGPFAGPFPSGAPAIAADAAARAGASVTLVAAVGKDPFGELLVEHLRADGVDVSLVRMDDHAVTGAAFVAYDESGGREFVFHVADAAPSRISTDDLGAAAEEADWIHVSGSSLSLSESLAETVLVAVERALANNGRVSFDPNLRLGSAGASASPFGFDRLLETSSLLLPSRGELEPLGVDATSVSEKGVLVCETAGQDGAYVYQNGNWLHFPAYPTAVADPTGAGDAFSGTFLANYMRNEDPRQAAANANVAAAAHVQAFGPMESGRRPPVGE